MFAFFRGYWNEFISSEGGFSLLLMDGLLLVPLIMAGFFYPVQVLIAVGVIVVLTVAAYRGARALATASSSAAHQGLTALYLFDGRRRGRRRSRRWRR